MDVGIEFEIVAVELVHLEVKQVIRLPLEVGHDLKEARHEPLQALQVIIGEGGKLLDRRKHVDELFHATAEEVEFAEDDILVEVKLLALGILGECIPHASILLLVLPVAVDAHPQPGDQVRHLLLPERAANLHVGTAVRDHLLRHLAEKCRHALCRVVVAGNCVHHLDVVEQAGQRLDDVRWRARV
eukprot:scaffold11206_cov117-Isochrysis_galbana.AAC.17